MRTAIVTNAPRFTSVKRSKINLAKQKKEFSMVKYRPMLDIVTAKERLSIPFAYRWLRFKTAILAKVLLRGVTL